MAKRPKSNDADDAAKRSKKAQQTGARVRELAKDFQKAHAKGMQALSDSDSRAFGEAIREERALIDEQAALIAATAKKRPVKKKASA